MASLIQFLVVGGNNSTVIFHGVGASYLPLFTISLCT